MSITAKDVQNLRQATGVGMMDAKKALEANNGDVEAATQWLRVQGLASAAKRADREAGEGAVAVVRDGKVAAMVELRCETDFAAKSDDFTSLVDEMAARVCAEGEGAVEQFTAQIETMLTTLKENISVGRVERFVAGEDEVVAERVFHADPRELENLIVDVARRIDRSREHRIAAERAEAARKGVAGG